MTRPKNDALKMHLTLLEFDFSVNTKSKRHLVKSRIWRLRAFMCESIKVHNVNFDLPKGTDKLSMKD
ncbi:hypothetical protein ES288_D11G096500v1 [Gossypium darwinii]|uniref:Uncharacterized protein n=1 Tax=Gossypium darwinii TaxID=34276 RepID=A0A5D2AJ79_GOSDA|nr:hypothetical protein ES288_D11G096500v1 [Gossypium darwinii]